jgi:hypothetical protein
MTVGGKNRKKRKKCKGKKKEQERYRTRKDDDAKVESNEAREKWKQARVSRRLTPAKRS